MDPFDLPVTIVTELDKRIAEIYAYFDHQCNKTADIRDVGSILRFLGCVPTNAEILEVIHATVYDDSGENIHLAKFLPYMYTALVEKRMAPATPEALLDAFVTLDLENKGYLDKDLVATAMLEDQEKLSEDELRLMLKVAVDPRTGFIPYEFYMNALVDKTTDSIYDLATKVHAEKIAAERAAKGKRLSDVGKQK